MEFNIFHCPTKKSNLRQMTLIGAFANSELKVKNYFAKFLNLG